MKCHSSVRISKEEYMEAKNLSKAELIAKYGKEVNFKIYDITATLLYYPDIYEVFMEGYYD